MRIKFENKILDDQIQTHLRLENATFVSFNDNQKSLL